ncbi:hypothetical protein EDC44_13117 [Cricetibacter osteomyelitidis]|uniref:Pyridoxal phosphatase n=1 Tax=Cricetibacter osteomyelitidis TaxID=1521931 RepID=A0A4R2SRR6_9PAST|nr:pyridoxal phosphatase [Cricetibacter osteomyelitidis]TCP91311.1 hypothetical protein EDC44_13117 [Cricetibacter osteomyelitidis]
MSYKVIAFDLDGTLLNSQGQILPSSKNAIAQACAKGVKVVLVSGRHHTAMRPYYYELGLDTPVICCNGTYIYDFTTDLVLSANPLLAQQAKKVIETGKRFGTHLLMYSRDAMNYQVLNEHMTKFNQWVQHCPSNVRPNLRQVDDFMQIVDSGDTIWKFVISHPDRDIMEQAVSALSTDEFSCEWSWVDRVDVANQGNSKGARLLELLQMWHIDPQNVIAFGDNHNDTSMLKAVGLGVAMSNAEAEVKQQVKLVTLTNDENGIEQVLIQYL